MKSLPYSVAKLYEAVRVRSSRLESGELRYGGNLLELSQEILGDSGTAGLCVECLLESQFVKLMIDLNSTGETVEHPHPTSEFVGEPQVFRVLEEEYQIGKEVDVMEDKTSQQVLVVMKQLALARKDGWIPSPEITRATKELSSALRRKILHRLVREGFLVLKGTRTNARYRLSEEPVVPVVPLSDEELLVQLAEKIQKLDEDIAELQKMLEESQQKKDELGGIRDDLRKLVEARQRARDLLAGK